MPAGFSSSNETELIQAERDVQARIAGLGIDLDFASLAAVSTLTFAVVKLAALL